jgi:hypothetical protein
MKKSLLTMAMAVLALLSSGPAMADVSFTFDTNGWTTPPVAVFVAGSFNHWSTTATAMSRDGTIWSARLNLPTDRYYYKFACRDARGRVKWRTDPKNDCMADDGRGGANSIVYSGCAPGKDGQPTLEYFEVKAQPRTKWINVAGDFNRWRQGQFNLVKVGPTTWRAFIEVQRPITYKYVIDGLWENRPDSLGMLVPDGYGAHNTFRRPLRWPVPAPETVPEAVQIGSTGSLEVLASLAHYGEYERAVGLARKIAKVNGPRSLLTFRALELEAVVHKRYGMKERAAECWKELVALDIDTTPSLRVAAELTAHYLYEVRRYGEARTLALERLARARTPLECISPIIHIAEAFRWEDQRELALAFVNAHLEKLPPPDRSKKDYACGYTELWLLKALTLHELGRRDEARLAFEKVVQYAPWPDSQAVLIATKWLRGMIQEDTRK